MANLSEAYGNVTITTNDKNNLKDFLYLHLITQQDTIYDTTLVDIETYGLVNRKALNEQLDETIKRKSEQYSIDLEVMGSGYDEFKNNIKEFFDIPLTTDYENEELNKIKNNLQNHKFSAMFEITDVQRHERYIEEATYELVYENAKSTIKTISKHEYEYCAESLMKIDNCDWASDRKCVLAHPEEFKDELKYTSEFKQKLLSDWELVKLALNELGDTVYTDFDDFMNDLADYALDIKKAKGWAEYNRKIHNIK